MGLILKRNFRFDVNVHPVQSSRNALPGVLRVECPLVLVVDLLEEVVEPFHSAYNVTLELPGNEPGLPRCVLANASLTENKFDVQRSAKVFVNGLVKFVPALA